jgi:Protein of unknown function (DUF3048).
MKKVLSVLLSLTLVFALFASCGKDNPQSEISDTPEVVEPDYFPNLLTGELRSDDYPVGQRPVAIVVNNIRGSMPQSGINDADIIYEVVTEGGITRLLAVYSDYSAVPLVGSVRSARDQHVQLMFPLEAIYVHIGGSTYATDMLRRYSYENLELDAMSRSGIFWQNTARISQGYSSEYTWYTDGEALAERIEHYGINTTATENRTAFNFVHYDEPDRELEGGEATGITIRFSQSYVSVFQYENGRYYKSQFGAPQIDANTGEQYSVENVIVIFTSMEKYPDGILTKVDFNFGGVGYYFSNGQYEQIRWIKGSPESPLRIVDMQGNEIDVLINPGQTYVAVVDLREYDYFSFSANGVDIEESFTTAPSVSEVEAED